MEERSQVEDTHWDQVMESLDLLFARVTDIGRDQQQIRAQLTHNTEVMEGYGHAQEILTRKVEVTSQAVNKWTSDFIGSDAPRQPLSPIHVPTGEIHPIHPQFPSGRPVADH